MNKKVTRMIVRLRYLALSNTYYYHGTADDVVFEERKIKKNRKLLTPKADNK